MLRSTYHAFRRHPLVERSPLLRQFVKFALVGVVNTLTDIGFYLAFTRLLGLPVLVANACSFTIAVTVSFTLNRNWTFREHSGRLHHQYTKFLLVNLVALAVSEGILYVAVHRLGIHDLVAKGIAVIIVVFWNFFANRYWTFRSAAPTSLPPRGL